MGTLGNMVQEYRNLKADNLARAGHAAVVREHEKADAKAKEIAGHKAYLNAMNKAHSDRTWKAQHGEDPISKWILGTPLSKRINGK